MATTLYLTDPIRDDDRAIECEEVRIIGDLVWATPTGGDHEAVVPLRNVAGVTGETVEQEVEAIEAPGGQFTELVTDVC